MGAVDQEETQNHILLSQNSFLETPILCNVRVCFVEMG